MGFRVAGFAHKSRSNPVALLALDAEIYIALGAVLSASLADSIRQSVETSHTSLADVGVRAGETVGKTALTLFS